MTVNVCRRLPSNWRSPFGAYSTRWREEHRGGGQKGPASLGGARPGISASASGLGLTRLPALPARSVPETADSLSQPLFACRVADGLLQLLEGPHFDLAHAFAADGVFAAQILQGRRLVLQPALGQDMALALVEGRERRIEQDLALGQLLGFAHARLLRRRVVDEPVLPLALAFEFERGV